MNKICLVGITFLFMACSSNPHKAKKIDTEMDSADQMNADSRIGVKDGNMVYQTKVNMAEELRRLQISVYSLEDRVYGSRKYSSLGLYGVLKQCRLKVVSKKNGGSGTLIWTEPMDRVTDKEDEFQIGLNEKKKIIGVSQEFLKDRIARFKGYKQVLQKREDEYKEKLDICQAKLKSQKFDQKKAARIKNQESLVQ